MLFSLSVIAAYAAIALHAVGNPRSVGARASVDEAAIVAEVRAFYRDLDDGNWTAVLDHFLPAKVTARWSPPDTNATWARLASPPPVANGAPSRCAPRMSVAVVRAWARVLVRRCAAPLDEAWLLRVGGRWKIVHLVLGADATISGFP